jgi:hypothetical protein
MGGGVPAMALPMFGSGSLHPDRDTRCWVILLPSSGTGGDTIQMTQGGCPVLQLELANKPTFNLFLRMQQKPSVQICCRLKEFGIFDSKSFIFDSKSFIFDSKSIFHF